MLPGVACCCTLPPQHPAAATLCHRALHATLACDSWLSLRGMERLHPRTAAVLGQQLHAVWATYFFGLQVRHSVFSGPHRGPLCL
jgi:hypothetical protein